MTSYGTVIALPDPKKGPILILQPRGQAQNKVFSKHCLTHCRSHSVIFSQFHHLLSLYITNFFLCTWKYFLFVFLFSHFLVTNLLLNTAINFLILNQHQRNFVHLKGPTASSNIQRLRRIIRHQTSTNTNSVLHYSKSQISVHKKTHTNTN